VPCSPYQLATPQEPCCATCRGCCAALPAAAAVLRYVPRLLCCAACRGCCAALPAAAAVLLVDCDSEGHQQGAGLLMLVPTAAGAVLCAPGQMLSMRYAIMQML
jgi:hypothetical protein